MSEFDNLFLEPIDPADITEALKADLLDVGWHPVQSIASTPRTVNKGANQGRPYLHFDVTVVGGRRVFFNASPQKRLDKNGKPDFMFRLWANIVQSVGGSTTIQEVLDKLQFSPIQIRVSHRANSQTNEPEASVVAVKTAAA